MDLSICNGCYLSLLNNVCPSRGKKSTRSIIYIGDSPSKLDVANNMVFSGRNTKLIQTYIDNYHLAPYSYLTNIIKCRTDISNKSYAIKCLPHLIKEIQDINPSIIITIGKLPYLILKDLRNINYNKQVNTLIKYNNSIMIPIHSPTYILKNNLIEEYDKSFRLISNIYSEINFTYKYFKP